MRDTCVNLDIPATMAGPLDEIVYSNARKFIAGLDRNHLPPVEEIKKALINETRLAVDAANRSMTSGSKYRSPNCLTAVQIAMLIPAIYPVCCIITPKTYCRGECFGSLAAFCQDRVKQQGLYVINGLAIPLLKSYIHRLNWNIAHADINRVLDILPEVAPKKEPCRDKNMIALDNGILDRSTKKLLPFSPEYIFLSKKPDMYITDGGRAYILSTDRKKQEIDEWLSNYKPSDSSL